jgi:hypothetical protein
MAHNATASLSPAWTGCRHETGNAPCSPLRACHLLSRTTTSTEQLPAPKCITVAQGYHPQPTRTGPSSQQHPAAARLQPTKGVRECASTCQSRPRCQRPRCCPCAPCPRCRAPTWPRGSGPARGSCGHMGSPTECRCQCTAGGEAPADAHSRQAGTGTGDNGKMKKVQARVWGAAPASPAA